MATRKNKKQSRGLTLAAEVLRRHFRSIDVSKLVSASREYPTPARVDLQRAIDAQLPSYTRATQLGIHIEYEHGTLTLAHILAGGHYPATIGPLQYQEIDIGEQMLFHCPRRVLWLAKDGTIPFVLIVGPASRYSEPTGTSVEIAVPPGEPGGALVRQILDQIDAQVRNAVSYRGRVISLSQADRYSGAMGALRVHKLKQVTEDELILPAKTIQLLHRSVIDFVDRREKLKALGLSAKKGLLFYGPPGTGKTHTIHYLASRLANHTTLLITSEQAGLLEHYCQLARFLQPALIVIEDADLIARAREQMGNVCEEVLLNKLLNEMDGLREDAEILFVLTTNRPEQLEFALASRPGRIDQAIEFPLPDEDGRRKLAKLYAGSITLSSGVLVRIVQKTQGASAALIKELMRRAAQFVLESGDENLSAKHVDAALEEMLFDGGSLNAKLLGGIGVGRPAD